MNTLITIVAVLNLSVCGGVKTGRLLGLDGGFGDGLIEIDIDTGEATFLFPFGMNPSGGGLAVGPDGTLYASFIGDINALVIVDPDTGDLDIVGPLTFGGVSGLAFGPDGTLYGLDVLTLQMITIDPETGEGTILGPTEAFVGLGLSFAPDGTLYACGFDRSFAPALFTINLQTGTATEVGAFGSFFSSTSSLAAIGDVLYASAYDPFGPPYDLLVTLDRETGEATIVGGFCADKGCLFANGLAFLPGPGDADRDGDVDLDDFAIFQFCFTGPLETRDPLPVECRFLDADNDNDLDLADFALFQRAFTGPNDDGE